MKIDNLKGKFDKVFNNGDQASLFRAPGRVNLIGEHTDYNDGLVLPIAINLSTYALIATNEEEKVRLFSENLGEKKEFFLTDTGIKRNDWTDYIRGIVSGLQNRTDPVRGFDLYINSEVPVGSGLSSSAALEIATAVGVKKELQLEDLGDLELIKLCQSAENDFVGANTGIMDQYVSYFGKSGAALLIDTSRPSHDPFELDLSGHELLVIDTTVSHTHGGNEYNKRRKECESALKTINENNAQDNRFSSLSQISAADLKKFKSYLPGIQYKRTKHVVEENERVVQTAKLLQEGKIERAGELFYASHESLRDLYEVSSSELDFLVEFAEEEGIPGARMTGGGFGGATIHLVPKGRLEEYRTKAKSEFEREFDIVPKCFVVLPSDGAKFQPTPNNYQQS
ncbi:galactokinase [Candidatus Bipolaricaulota bacterium]|nr:galactokinase [Candidatus Bipolaricaulota bacterium]